ncbi:hypothetical protein VNO77_19454 [Canavalia gladiata]|uniref:Uncharacterized protein n=1 Tax=Canavalia gladiata TaxID=3824 RepID=A0AAN9QKI3_CANGL
MSYSRLHPHATLVLHHEGSHLKEKFVVSKSMPQAVDSIQTVGLRSLLGSARSPGQDLMSWSKMFLTEQHSDSNVLPEIALAQQNGIPCTDKSRFLSRILDPLPLGGEGLGGIERARLNFHAILFGGNFRITQGPHQLCNFLHVTLRSRCILTNGPIHSNACAQSGLSLLLESAWLFVLEMTKSPNGVIRAKELIRSVLDLVVNLINGVENGFGWLHHVITNVTNKRRPLTLFSLENTLANSPNYLQSSFRLKQSLLVVGGVNTIRAVWPD